MSFCDPMNLNRVIPAEGTEGACFSFFPFPRKHRKGVFCMLEVTVSRLIIEDFFQQLHGNLHVDVAIIGAGPSGLMAGALLAQKGYKVVIFERWNQPGGGIWGGGMLFNSVVLPLDLEQLMQTLNIPYTRKDTFIIVSSTSFAAGLILHAERSGAKIFNNVTVEDLVLEDGRVEGVVINWGPVSRLSMPVDPLMVKAQYVVDATGHPASGVSHLASRGLLKVKGEGALNVAEGEKGVVKATKEVYPGLFVAGMAATATLGAPRMGPIFGGMLHSGMKVAKMIDRLLGGDNR